MSSDDENGNAYRADAEPKQNLFGEGTSSNASTFVNILKSYTGSGILALPYAFQQGGLAIACLGYFLVAGLALHCMFILLNCKVKLSNDARLRFESQSNDSSPIISGIDSRAGEDSSHGCTDDGERFSIAPDPSRSMPEDCLDYDRIIMWDDALVGSDDGDAESIKRANDASFIDSPSRSRDHFRPTSPLLPSEKALRVETFSEVGYAAFGTLGKYTVDVTLLCSQFGFCVVYVIFIAENMASLVPQVDKLLWIAIALPGLACLAMLRSLRLISPFSLIALTCNLVGFGVIVGYAVLDFPSSSVEYVSNPLDFFIFLSLAIYGYEGIGLVLPVENAARDKKRFKVVFSAAFSLVTMLFIAFGAVCYVAYGKDTEAIVVLNLPKHSPAVYVVKPLFVLGAALTYPLFLWPVFERMEPALFNPMKKWFEAKRTALRTTLVLSTGAIAALVPEFDLVTALIGSVFATTLAFIIPAALDARVFVFDGKPAGSWRNALIKWMRFAKDLVLACWGLAAMVCCTAVTVYQLQERLRDKYL